MNYIVIVLVGYRKLCKIKMNEYYSFIFVAFFLIQFLYDRYCLQIAINKFRKPFSCQNCAKCINAETHSLASL